jgi:hypothetical protein
MRGIAIFLVLLSFAASAVELKITSLRWVGPIDNRTAEVCGMVKDQENFPTYIRLTADKRWSPGHFQTFAGPDGKFCQLIHTYYGTVDAEIIGSASQGSSATYTTGK